MKLIGPMTGLLLLLMALPAFAEMQQAQCPQVNCDCGAIKESKWRDLCLAREVQVVKDCVANQGKPKSFCGLHGPPAVPVATSIQARKPAAATDQSVDIIQQLIGTQSWSLDESFKVLKNREKAQQFGDALQVLGLLERDTERLYVLQQQALSGLRRLDRRKEANELGAGYAQKISDRAKLFQTYGEELWRSASEAESERNQKAYRALAFKSARLAAVVYEYGADLYDLSGAADRSALAWQAAAELAHVLGRWESATEKKVQHIEFYQAQAVARWHRATYEWLQTSNTEAVIASFERAATVADSDGTMLVESDHALHDNAADSRAIKRGSR